MYGVPEKAEWKLHTTEELFIVTFFRFDQPFRDANAYEEIFVTELGMVIDVTPESQSEFSQ
jgi:hypothetical protein